MTAIQTSILMKKKPVYVTLTLDVDLNEILDPDKILEPDEYIDPDCNGDCERCPDAYCPYGVI